MKTAHEHIKTLKAALDHSKRFAGDARQLARLSERGHELEMIELLLKGKNGRPGHVPIDIDAKIHAVAQQLVVDFPTQTQCLDKAHSGRGLLAELRGQRVLKVNKNHLCDVRAVSDATRSHHMTPPHKVRSLK